ncbi:DUF5931 domain-containing protein [Streptomyces malaysiensis subsp. malaysiensis]|uniref:MacS family sensor histidine kinase n=2 Tax=Streptomyces TaxID=1883 RepID=UPI0022B78910|nr:MULTISPECIES: DUF5931 domain-containing protein [unclassified Streptomyces]MCQ6252689.1 DUF5931 domain-containing protein [Streptomyces malaysiensis]WHX21505.1 DUF5931 domain-containing protein [Streptomyces sp. NA07423]
MAERSRGERAGGERVVRMSVEQPLWQALTAYRVLTLLYALGLCVYSFDDYDHPVGAVVYMAVLTLWTALTFRMVSSAERCTRRFLVGDLGIAVTGILLTPLVDNHDRIAEGTPTLPSIWTMGAVLGFAIKGGWRWGASASTVVCAANVIERGEFAQDTIHMLSLVWVASVGIGYVVEVARASERTLARALRIEAATRERERLARDIHDSVLQVLAMVQRRGAAIGGEAAELGRMAGEQEIALRTLVSTGLVTPSRGADGVDAVPDPDGLPDAVGPSAEPSVPGPERSDGGPCDLRALLAPHAGSRVTFSEPGAPVVLPAGVAGELAAAVGAALDNVRVHAGQDAHAWILLEDEPDAVMVTVRDDGPGIPEGRLADAEAEGRLGVALSIRGRLRDLGGTAAWISAPGQGTEVELTVPKASARKAKTKGEAAR